jgi:hypothetical protein
MYNKNEDFKKCCFLLFYNDFYANITALCVLISSTLASQILARVSCNKHR